MRIWKMIAIALALLLVGCGQDPGEADGVAAKTAKPSTDASGVAGSAGEERTGSRSGLRAVTINASGGEKVKVHVEIADDIFERARGLMYRKNLGENRGMLFAYTEEDTRSFYMKNTYIPLSIAFMDSEGRIIDIQDMKPLDDEDPDYVSAKPAQYALEVNQGFFDERGVEVGDRAKLPV